MRNFVLAFLTLTLALPVLATDGVLEINQSCAVNTGCFAGDLAGFPVHIGTGGSYRLTSDLDVAGNTSAIEFFLNVNDVTLDLNGFTMSSGTEVNNGIQITNNRNVEIRDGTVRNFLRGAQISTVGAAHIRFVNLRVIANAADGLQLINANEAEVRDCTVVDDGTTGIAVGENSLIVGNRVTGNGGFGIVMGAGSGYGGNLIGNNAGGTASGGVQMGTNVCNGNTTCP